VRKGISLLVLSLVILCSSIPAFAADTTGIYVAGKGGVSFENSNEKGNIGGGYANSSSMQYGQYTSSVQMMIQDLFSSSNHNSTNTSGTFGGAIGYDFQQYPFRVELEYLYRTQANSSFESSGISNYSYQSAITNNSTGATLSSGGSTPLANAIAGFSRKDTIHTVMLNGYWDIVNYNGFVPYVGGGVGLAFHNVRDSANVAYTTANNAGSYGYGVSKNQTLTRFAWMASAGVAYKITANWAVDLGYRVISFGDTGTTSLGAAPYTIASGAPTFVDAVSVKGGTTISNEVLLSLRYTF